MNKFWNRETCSCVVNFFFLFPIRLAGTFCSEIQRYQLTYAFFDPQVKLVTRVTTKFWGKFCLITKSNLLNISSKTVYKNLLFNS